MGKSVYDIAPEHLADTYQKADEKLFREKGTQIYEPAVKYSDASIHDVIFNKAVFLNKEGAVAGMVGVMVDITEKKQPKGIYPGKGGLKINPGINPIHHKNKRKD